MGILRLGLCFLVLVNGASSSSSSSRAGQAFLEPRQEERKTSWCPPGWCGKRKSVVKKILKDSKSRTPGFRLPWKKVLGEPSYKFEAFVLAPSQEASRKLIPVALVDTASSGSDVFAAAVDEARNNPRIFAARAAGLVRAEATEGEKKLFESGILRVAPKDIQSLRKLRTRKEFNSLPRMRGSEIDRAAFDAAMYSDLKDAFGGALQEVFQRLRSVLPEGVPVFGVRRWFFLNGLRESHEDTIVLGLRRLAEVLQVNERAIQFPTSNGGETTLHLAGNSGHEKRSLYVKPENEVALKDVSDTTFFRMQTLSSWNPAGSFSVGLVMPNREEYLGFASPREAMVVAGELIAMLASAYKESQNNPAGAAPPKDTLVFGTRYVTRVAKFPVEMAHVTPQMLEGARVVIKQMPEGKLLMEAKTEGKLLMEAKISGGTAPYRLGFLSPGSESWKGITSASEARRIAANHLALDYSAEENPPLHNILFNALRNNKN